MFFFEILFNKYDDYLLLNKTCCLVVLLTCSLFYYLRKNIFYGTDFIAFILFHISFSDNLFMQEVVVNE